MREKRLRELGARGNWRLMGADDVWGDADAQGATASTIDDVKLTSRYTWG